MRGNYYELYRDKAAVKYNSEFEFCALECIMLMDKVTGCAKLYSEFGIVVVPQLPLLGSIVLPLCGNCADIVSALRGTLFQKIYYKIHRARDNLSPCSVSYQSFLNIIAEGDTTIPNYELRIPNLVLRSPLPYPLSIRPQVRRTPN